MVVAIVRPYWPPLEEELFNIKGKYAIFKAKILGLWLKKRTYLNCVVDD